MGPEGVRSGQRKEAREGVIAALSVLPAVGFDGRFSGADDASADIADDTLMTPSSKKGPFRRHSATNDDGCGKLFPERGGVR